MLAPFQENANLAPELWTLIHEAKSAVIIICAIRASLVSLCYVDVTGGRWDIIISGKVEYFKFNFYFFIMFLNGTVS